MHLDPERSERQTPSRICRHHGYIGPAGKIAPVIMKLRPLLQRRGLGGGGMHLDPERSERQTPSRICRHHEYIGPAGKIPPVIMKLRPLLQIQWPAHPRRAPVERLGGSARRSRPASLVAPFAAVGGRRSAVGGRRSAAGR